MDLAVISTLGILLAVLSVPLMLGWVPRNYLYGFRVAATLRDDRIWYAVNRAFGREAIVIGLAIGLPATLADIAGYDTAPVRYGLTAVAIAGSVWLIVRHWRGANRLAREQERAG